MHRYKDRENKQKRKQNAAKKGTKITKSESEKKQERKVVENRWQKKKRKKRFEMPKLKRSGSRI